ncbi:MAG: cupin domain-containing protein [Gammaproteobacteria bacterium]|nr:cupin domain-containing protein [Gammaproteobacteria bacterium]
MKGTLIPFSDKEEFFTEELCHIIELSNSSDDQDVSIAQARVEVGVTTRWHRLKHSTERYYILSGHGEVQIGEPGTHDACAKRVAAGDIVLIPPMCPQRIRNCGQEDLVFLAICSPRFMKENYGDLEPNPPKS